MGGGEGSKEGLLGVRGDPWDGLRKGLALPTAIINQMGALEAERVSPETVVQAGKLLSASTALILIG